MEVEIGIGKSGRRAYGFDDIAIVPSRRTRDPEDEILPTVRELGFPSLELQGWNGFLAPKATPAVVVARLQQEIAAAARHPDLRRRMEEVGAEPSGSTSEEMRQMLRDQVAKVKPAVEELKLVVQ